MSNTNNDANNNTTNDQSQKTEVPVVKVKPVKPDLVYLKETFSLDTSKSKKKK